MPHTMTVFAKPRPATTAPAIVADHDGTDLRPSPAAAGMRRPSLTDRLREETRDRHEALEERLDWRRRMATPEGYRSLLARWWGFHHGFEPVMAAALGAEFAQPRRKLHLLERDLGHFGMEPDAIAALPRFAVGSHFEDRSAIVGALYVIEGSTLGGQVIAQYVRRVLGTPDASGGCAYFESYGKRRTGPMWASFRAFLDQSVEESEADGVIAGARRTFDGLALWLADDGPIPTGPPLAASR